MSSSLPKGVQDTLSLWDPAGWGYNDAGDPVRTATCECGSWKTYGKEIEQWQHSSWCPVYVDPKKKDEAK